MLVIRSRWSRAARRDPEVNDACNGCQRVSNGLDAAHLHSLLMPASLVSTLLIEGYVLREFYLFLFSSATEAQRVCR